jgi:hypothetical protein
MPDESLEAAQQRKLSLLIDKVIGGTSSMDSVI